MSIKEKKIGVWRYLREILEEFLKGRRDVSVQEKKKRVSEIERGLNRQQFSNVKIKFSIVN